jgi:hypothetical protein
VRATLFIVAILTALTTVAATAGGRYVGKVRPHYFGGNLYLSPISAQIIGKPVCATRSLLRLQEMDQNSPVFKNKYSMILSFWLAGKELELYGTGECTGEGDETIKAIIPHIQ